MSHSSATGPKDGPVFPVPAEQLLPHRKPMRLLDQLEHVQGDAGTGTAIVAKDWLLLDPGGRLDRAGFVELCAQTYAAVAGWRQTRQGEPPREGYLVGVQSFGVDRDVGLGEKLTVRVQPAGEFQGFVVVEAEVALDSGDIVAQGKIKLWVPEPGQAGEASGHA